jgi:hypothetical protein
MLSEQNLKHILKLYVLFFELNMKKIFWLLVCYFYDFKDFNKLIKRICGFNLYKND